MIGPLRQTMAWFHGWSGIVAGWVLYLMFVAGSAAVFKDEITHWMTPEIASASLSGGTIDRAIARLQSAAPHAASWTISLPDSRDPATRLSWRLSEDGPATREVLGEAGAATPRETRGGDFFYRLHYRFDQPGRSGWGYSAAMAIVMLSILVSGIITHKRFFSDFFTFRPAAHRQRSWLDAHLVFGVLLLPFHLAITYTGLIPIVSTVMPFGMLANYGNGAPLVRQFADPSIARKAFAEERSDRPEPKPSGRAQALPRMEPFVSRAQRSWGVGQIAAISIRLPGDSNATIEFARSPDGIVSHRRERIVYTIGGAEITDRREFKPAADTQAFLYGLHMARFADPLLRWAYFFAGLGSAALIATGVILWTVKRTTGHHSPSRFDRVIARLNPGVIVGLPVACAGFFLANRLLPVGIADRPLMEVRSFFLVWIATLALSLMLGGRKGWLAITALLAAASGMVPIVNAATTDLGLTSTLARGDWLTAGFDLTLLVVAAASAAIVWRLRGNWEGARP